MEDKENGPDTGQESWAGRPGNKETGIVSLKSSVALPHLYSTLITHLGGPGFIDDEYFPSGGFPVVH